MDVAEVYGRIDSLGDVPATLNDASGEGLVEGYRLRVLGDRSATNGAVNSSPFGTDRLRSGVERRCRQCDLTTDPFGLARC